jgi:quercetin dioxygenase-like cupin family protein
VIVASPEKVEFSDAWIEGDHSARWRSAAAHGPGTGARSSGSSLMEVGPGCKLPRHTDSEEETIAVVSGTAEVVVEDESSQVAAGGVAVVPKDAPHEVRNAGDDALRFVAIYAGTDVVSRYEEDVQPEGSRERKPVA